MKKYIVIENHNSDQFDKRVILQTDNLAEAYVLWREEMGKRTITKIIDLEVREK